MRTLLFVFTTLFIVAPSDTMAFAHPQNQSIVSKLPWCFRGESTSGSELIATLIREESESEDDLYGRSCVELLTSSRTGYVVITPDAVDVFYSGAPPDAAWLSGAMRFFSEAGCEILHTTFTTRAPVSHRRLLDSELPGTHLYLSRDSSSLPPPPSGSGLPSTRRTTISRVYADALQTRVELATTEGASSLAEGAPPEPRTAVSLGAVVCLTALVASVGIISKAARSKSV